MGMIKPKIVSDLMDVANRFADGEDACNNKRTRSPEDDRGNRYVGQGNMVTVALVRRGVGALVTKALVALSTIYT
jgi:hypothetical protein